MTWAGRWICGMRWEVIGAENLPDGPAILLPKHQSTWETFFLIWAMPRDLCFVFKRELLYVPFFGWGMALLKMIHIDRTQGRNAFDSRRQAGRRAARRRALGDHLPGRHPRFRPACSGKYKSGGARLAIRTGTPVVPIAINAGRLWPKGKLIKKPGLITVSIGKPIESAGKTPERLTT